MLFCCLWRNAETSCHKNFAVISRHQQTPPLTTNEVSQLAGRWSDDVVLTTPGWWQRQQHAVNSDIGSYRDFCLPHLNSAPSLRGGGASEYCCAVWYGKTRMVWLPGCEKILKIYLFVLTECTNMSDTRTDRHHMTT